MTIHSIFNAAASTGSLVKWFYDSIRKWDSMQIAKYSLGKYIIGFACLLHLSWATLLMIDIRAGNATAIFIFFQIFHERWIVVSVLTLAALLASCFINFRMRLLFNTKWLSFLLLPQQMVLSCSALAGIRAVLQQRYLDGTPMSWSHILADQLPIIVTALLYTVACLETRSLPFENEPTIEHPRPRP